MSCGRQVQRWAREPALGARDVAGLRRPGLPARGLPPLLREAVPAEHVVVRPARACPWAVWTPALAELLLRIGPAAPPLRSRVRAQAGGTTSLADGLCCNAVAPRPAYSAASARAMRDWGSLPGGPAPRRCSRSPAGAARRRRRMGADALWRQQGRSWPRIGQQHGNSSRHQSARRDPGTQAAAQHIADAPQDLVASQMAKLVVVVPESVQVEHEQAKSRSSAPTVQQPRQPSSKARRLGRPVSASVCAASPSARASICCCSIALAQLRHAIPAARRCHR